VTSQEQRNPITRFVKESQIWRSLFRQPYPTTSRTRALAVMNNVFLHLHPVRVKRHAVRYTYTFCLGGISFFLFLALTVTGLYLMFFYVPSVSRAYQDIVAIDNSIAFGSLVRNMHRWAAHLMVLTVFLHMIRVFYHGAYKPPREFNWVIGVLMLFCTLWLSFTGYLLPWDQIAFWAITVGTQMATYAPLLSRESSLFLLGGIEVGQNTLLRFYVFHVIAFPLIIAILMVVHFWRIRKDGGISGPV
jgi:quinol-cytochrome oxidoreductase complex cytochrome b subunit